MNTSWTGAEAVKAVVCGLVILGGALYFALILSGQKPPPALDRYGCLIGQPVSCCTLVLADVTDPYSPSQAAAFHQTMEDILANSPAWGMVALTTIGNNLPPKKIGQAGSPPRVSASSDIWDNPYQSRLEINSHYQKAFYQPLQKLENQMPFNSTARQSPVFQSIKQAMNGLGGYWRDARTRKLVVFSDLMENTHSFTQYTPSIKLDFKAAKTRCPYLSDRLDLKDVSVVVHYLTGFPADRPYQGKDHQRFWQDLFQANGAEVQFIEVSAQSNINPQTQNNYVQSPNR